MKIFNIQNMASHQVQKVGRRVMSHMASVEHESIMSILGAEPPAWFRGRDPCQGVRSEAP